MVSRIWYIIFYIAYLLVLAVALWFLLYYSGIETWIWSLFAAAIAIFIVGIIIKETLLVDVVTESGIPVDTGVGFWKIIYYLAHIVAFILIFTGLVFTITQSPAPWWVWGLLSLSIIVSVLSTMLQTLGPYARPFAVLVYIISFGLYIAAIVLLVIYSEAPWWIWLIVGAAFALSIIYSIFENISEPNIRVIPDADVDPLDMCPDDLPDCADVADVPTDVEITTGPTRSIPTRVVDDNGVTLQQVIADDETVQRVVTSCNESAASQKGVVVESAPLFSPVRRQTVIPTEEIITQARPQRVIDDSAVSRPIVSRPVVSRPIVSRPVVSSTTVSRPIVSRLETQGPDPVIDQATLPPVDVDFQRPKVVQTSSKVIRTTVNGRPCKQRVTVPNQIVV